MKNRKPIIKQSVQNEVRPRRTFIKKLGMGILATSAYTIVSLTPFACKHEPLEPSNNGGY